MPPKFSLQTVLDVRHSRVEALEIELGKLLHTQQEGRNRLERLQNLQRDLHRQLLEQQHGEIDLFLVGHLRANARAAAEQIRQVEKALHKLEVQIEAKRQDLIEAKQAEETLGNLKEKELEAFYVELAERDKRSQDDIYTAQAYRQRCQEAKYDG